ncbi:MAG: hypothetical protein RLY21_1937 [Planctomycetota bacterium]|jgi:uncharacterized protein YqgC (DUF456 family)
MTIESIPIGVGVGFAFFGLLCVLLVVAGLPGTWILIAAAILIDCLDWLWLPPGSPLTFHPLTLIAAVLVGLVGEALEFALSAAGAKRFGATKRGMLGAVIGGVIGAIAGTALIWIPIIGTFIGALAGTAAGAIIGETSDGKKTMREAAQPALGAVLGRVLGTLAKLPIAVIVLAILAVAVFRD